MMSIMHLNINIGAPCLAVLAVLAAAVSGCQKTAGSSAVDKDNTVFEVTSEYPTQQGATLVITHNGPADCRFAGCVHETDIPAEEAVLSRLEELREASAGTSFSALTFRGREYTDVVTGLMPNREYCYTVFGVNEDFTTYGTPGTSTFTTQTGAGLFVLNRTDATEINARIQVLPRSGYDNYTYFVFWTDDFDTPVGELIEKAVASLSDPGQYLSSGNVVFNVPGDSRMPAMGSVTSLEAGGRYRAVVTGMYEDGRTYGIPAEMIFKTSRGDLPYQFDSDWEVSYAGKGIYRGDAVENIRVDVAPENSEKYYNRFFVSTVEGSRLPSFLADYKANGPLDLSDEKYLEGTYQEELAKVIYEEQQLLSEQIDIYNELYGMELTVENFSYTSTIQDPFESLPENTDYFAIAIGIDVDEEVTGLYSLSQPFQTEIPEVPAAYNDWLGTWTVTGRYTASDGNTENVSFDITVSSVEGAEGIGYNVSGFGAVEGLVDAEIEIPQISVLFDRESHGLEWTGEYIDEITVSAEDGMTASLYFAAIADNDVIVGENFVMAASAPAEDGSTSIEARTFDVDGDPFLPLSMGYVADVPYVGYMLVSVNPQFPMTMVKKDVGSSQTMSSLPQVRRSGLSARTGLPLRPRVSRQIVQFDNHSQL